MRAQVLSDLLSHCLFEVIDTNLPFFQAPRLVRSVGFRFKKGPLIKKINSYILDGIKNEQYDLIWIDKGIFIDTTTIRALRKSAKRLVHFTPDMAFFANQSNLFNQSINYYDFVVTTKSCETEIYKSLVSEGKFIFTTQGFDKQIHRPFNSFEDKENAVCFIGLAEPHRIKMAQLLIDNNIVLNLGGKGWTKFIKRNKKNPNLRFLGEAIFKESYSKFISSSLFGLGLLSKRFPEKSTTRTFEIPACGTALLTEDNPEIRSFFEEEEVIFFNDSEELIEKIKYYQNHLDQLEKVTEKGLLKVTKGGFAYHSILKKILKRVLES